MLVGILGKMSTENYDYGDLSNEINIHTGGISIHADTFGINGSDKEYESKFIIKSKALTEKVPQLIKLLKEIIDLTKFDDEKRLLEIIREMKSRMEMNLYAQGHVVAYERLMSYFTEKGAYNEQLKGFSFYQFIVDLEENFQAKKVDIISNLKKAASAIFNINHLIIGLTSEEKDYKVFQDNLSLLTENLNKEKRVKQNYTFNITNKNEGLMTQSDVQYVAKGYNFLPLSYNYSGSMQVLKTIISLDYLWNKVRVQGGAYGAFFNVSRTGNIYFASYRDPNLKKTLEVYDAAADYIQNFDASERDMTKYIIGTISRYDFPLTPSMKGEKAVSLYISQISQEDIQKNGMKS